MKSAIVLFALVAVAAVAGYDIEKYEKVDFKGIVEGPQLKDFLVCFADNATCNDFTVQFKDDFTEMIKTACAECTPKLKSQLKQFLGASQDRFPAETNAALGKLDPKQVYVPALQAALADA